MNVNLESKRSVTNVDIYAYWLTNQQNKSVASHPIMRQVTPFAGIELSNIFIALQIV